MTIKELEQRTGMARANIRFYEGEGLLAPKRLENGYRDYSEEDARTLEKIKLLRQLQLDIDTIRRVQAGTLTLDQALFVQETKLEGDKLLIERAAAVCRELGYTGGLEVIVSIPGGEEAASRTFNPMLGVAGGLSVLGTSGIVEPMSEQAIVDTIAVQQRQAAATGSRRVILTPGNYGADYLREAGPALAGVPVVKCSNFLGDALDIAASLGFEQVLLAAHIGKLVKVAGGIMQTHSRYADCRTELFCAHAAVCGGGPSLCRSLLDAATTDACLALLDGAGLRDAVLESLLAAVQRHLTRRAAGAYLVGAVTFSNEYGALGATDQAKEIIETWRQEKESFTA